VAFALVWADGSEPVDNVNQAFAAASCTRCAAIAVAFQVVLVVGEADVAVPQNLSVAVNYDCTSCLTYSLAVQLFITLDGPLSDDAMARMEELWAQIMEFGQNIGSVPLDQIQDQLSSFEEQILDIIEEDQGPLTEDPAATGSPSPSESASPTEATTTSPSSEPTESSATSPSPTTTTSTSTSPSPTTSTSPSPTTSATPTEDPQPTSSGSVTPTSEASPAEASTSP
jgi:putative peptide zinc metalloprotease protein